MNLLQQYHQYCEQGDYVMDPGQVAILQRLQDLADELQADTGSYAWLKNLFSRSQSQPPQGIYLWGGVGRGKTFLVDLFYESLAIKAKKRLHFHRFMNEVHHRLNQLDRHNAPLKTVAKQFAEEAKVICFDEFFVTNIADAMILGGLLDALFAEGVVFIATSNCAPDKLYENGLHRDRFLPAIELITTHTEVIQLDHDTDYRLRTLEAAEIYHYPLDDTAQTQLKQYFNALCPSDSEHNISIEILGRTIQAHSAGDGIIWFEFVALCDGPRSQNDYIEIATLYQTVLVSHIPCLSVDKEEQARRFISLVDEFYDRNVKLIISAENPIETLYQGERLQFEFERTQSRLQEMQSHEYLQKPHKP